MDTIDFSPALPLPRPGQDNGDMDSGHSGTPYSGNPYQHRRPEEEQPSPATRSWSTAIMNALVRMICVIVGATLGGGLGCWVWLAFVAPRLVDASSSLLVAGVVIFSTLLVCGGFIGWKLSR